MAEQVVPGHSIPSQDPEPATQLTLRPGEAKRKVNSVVIIGGVEASMATGAAIGEVLACPVGLLTGVAVGEAVGALDGEAAGAASHHAGSDLAQTTPSSGVRLHIEDSGAGRAVVLIHGWPLSAQAWEPQVSALQSAGYRVVVYDRRGFGRSDKPQSGYDYDTLADDLERVMDQCGLQDATLVGFSMGGGEVARYITRHGESRLKSIVFAAAVPPYLLKTADNPDGPLNPEKAKESRHALEQDRSAYFEQFTTNFFSANGTLLVSESQRAEAIAICQQSAPHAALACMDSFSSTDFRQDLMQVKVPTLVIHGDADAVVPFAGSGQRTHNALSHSGLLLVGGAPHGLNVTHSKEFNTALLSFLQL
jgi:pimeloyl-ACP methyl ester carboxylesterase